MTASPSPLQYSDKYWNEYIGDGVEIAIFIGEEIDDEEDLFHDYYKYMAQCWISCST